jgi:excisionase family DNA binding protein
MSERRPLFVRLPAAAADKLDRAAFELKVSKQTLVTDLVANHLDATAAPRRVTVELPEEHLTVGRHEFRPAPAPEVLTLEDLAALLQADPAVVAELADAGELPGRRVGGAWRFSREAVLAWLAHA